MLRLDRKVALVTGASKGIGAATARVLGSLGATVAVHYRQDADGAGAVVSDSGPRARPFAADLSRWAEAERLVASFMTGEIVNVNGGAVLCG